MILRPRQARLVERTLAALETHGNTLAIAPTGAGKTVMLSAVAGALLAAQPDAKACILAHRDELTEQNRTTFARVNPDIPTSVFNATEKSWSGRATFAMVQTLARGYSLPKLDLLIIDEAHHAAADSYRRIIDTTLAHNPQAKVLGVTATPVRGDGKALGEVFSNIADQITLRELIASGHLVPPRTFVIDVGAQKKLTRVRRTAVDFDMEAVSRIMNTAPITQAVIQHWWDKAKDRPTLIFCSTIAHAEDVCQAFCDAGIAAVLIHGELSAAERKKRLADYESGQCQVAVNVAVLTEGYDYTPTACIVLLRPSSHPSTLIQMVGRGLRPVDSVEYPGVVKTDCIVLDFGTATLMHGALEQTPQLEGRPHGSGEAPTKTCPSCEATVPLSCRTCPACGKRLGPDDFRADFNMSEIDVVGRSHFAWCDLFGDDAALMASGFMAWSGVFCLEGRWYAVGGGNHWTPRLLAVGDRTVCLAQADDWLNAHEPVQSAHKTRHWIDAPPTQKQLRYLLPVFQRDAHMTRYQASTRLSFQFNKEAIQRLVFSASEANGKETEQEVA